MEMLQHRRKAVTYGKSRKKLHLDNIFHEQAIGKSQINASDLSEQEASKPALTKKRTPNGIEIRGYKTLSTPRGENSPLVSPPTADHSQDSSDSSSSRSSHQNGSANSSILDMLDSDEEACAQQLQPVDIKRRKITSLSNRPRPANNARVQKPDQAAATATRKGQKYRTAIFRQDRPLQPQHVGRTVLTHGDSSRHDALDQAGTKAPTNSSKTRSKRRSTHYDGLSLASSASLRDTQERQQRNGQPDQDQDSLAMQRSPPQTPRARRTLQTREQLSQSVASPSQLGLISLRLTPDKKHQPLAPSLKDDSLTPRRVRQRLTDRLDAPGGDLGPQSASSGSDNELRDELDEGFTSKSALVPRPRTPASVAFADVPALPEIPRAVDDRSKLTYAKERSHLSDMVDEIEHLKAPTPTLLKTTVPTSSSRLFNQEATAINDDNDDTSAATAVKSIHELRQAGLNNRFERDLETLFEDIEAHSSPSKTLRIQALLQLTQKLGQTGFARQFLAGGMTRRLAQCAQADADTVGAVLLIYALSCLFSLKENNAQTVLASFQAIVRLSPNMLTYTRPFTKLVTDRRQNLSKALSRDLVEFSKATKIGPSPDTILWTPQLVALFALEHSLRTIRGLKAVPAEFPTALFNQILDLLSTACDTIAESGIQHQVVTVTLSILEYSAVFQASHGHKADGNTTLNYCLLGDVVTKLMDNAASDHADQRSIALRLVVSLTNNEPVVCSALAMTELIPAVFSVVKQELPLLSNSADRGDEFDNSKLDSVIMALGCLLNLADCSSEARKRMYIPSATSSNNVQWLVAVFNDRAGKAAEATTIAQSQVLVAFGYMSMLLCTLCLDDNVYTYVASSVQGKDVTALCIEAEEFLEKLETVARLNPDDPATSTFNERFRSILASLSTRSS